MAPEKVMELVKEYSSVNRGLKTTTKAIGDSLDKCKGINGKRGAILSWDSKDSEYTIDAKGRDLNLHLTNWYKADIGEDYEPYYEPITPEKHRIECIHCYTAHLLIQHRKNLRKRFGIIKGTMSRFKEN